MRNQLFLVVSLVVASGAALAAPIDWVPIRNPHNAADTASNCLGSPADCGSVDHAYYISKYETTNPQYAEFLNAKATSDPLSLYHYAMDSDPRNGGISQNGSTGSYTYTVKPGFENKPVALVSFYDALRFANWLNNGGGNADTETGAYTITPEGIANNTIERNSGAQIFLPSENEWYKAAYFDGTSYFDYPAGLNAETTCAIPGATPNTANCDYVVSAVTDVGAYAGSASPYGTFDQGGNVMEWNESTSGSNRGFRAGSWVFRADWLAASDPEVRSPDGEREYVGFRVASSVPEPEGTSLLAVAVLLGLTARRKRHAKAL